MKVNKWRILVGVLLLGVGAGAGAWWWLGTHPTPAGKPPALTSEISLQTFTLSIAKKGGMTGYLVLGVTVAVKGPQNLPKDWLKSHAPRIQSSILSSLLDLPNIRRINTDKLVRADVRKAVSVDMQPLLPPKLHVSGVYITKLIVQ